MFEFDAKRLAYCLKAKRIAGKLSAKAAGEVVGISQGSVSRVERGLGAEIFTFTKICTWMQIEPGQFFTKVEV